MRRRVRFLRKTRELAYRDLGGLVFSLHRFGQRNDALVLAKLSRLGQIDTELRALEAALEESQQITVLREAGVTACQRCAAIHASQDSFCPNCGLPMSRRVDLPIAGPPAASPAPGTAAVQPRAASDGPAPPAAAAGRAPSTPAPAPARAPEPSQVDTQAQGFPRVREDRPDSSGEPARGRGAAQRGERAAESGERTEILRPPAGGA